MLSIGESVLFLKCEVDKGGKMDVLHSFDYAVKRLFGRDEFRCWSRFRDFTCKILYHLTRYFEKKTENKHEIYPGKFIMQANIIESAYIYQIPVWKKVL